MPAKTQRIVFSFLPSLRAGFLSCSGTFTIPSLLRIFSSVKYDASFALSFVLVSRYLLRMYRIFFHSIHCDLSLKM